MKAYAPACNAPVRILPNDGHHKWRFYGTAITFSGNAENICQIRGLFDNASVELGAEVDASNDRAFGDDDDHPHRHGQASNATTYTYDANDHLTGLQARRLNTAQSGTVTPTFGYAGMFTDPTTGLSLTLNHPGFELTPKSWTSKG